MSWLMVYAENKSVILRKFAGKMFDRAEIKC